MPWLFAFVDDITINQHKLKNILTISQHGEVYCALFDIHVRMCSELIYCQFSANKPIGTSFHHCEIARDGQRGDPAVLRHNEEKKCQNIDFNTIEYWIRLEANNETQLYLLIPIIAWPHTHTYILIDCHTIRTLTPCTNLIESIFAPNRDYFVSCLDLKCEPNFFGEFRVSCKVTYRYHTRQSLCAKRYNVSSIIIIVCLHILHHNSSSASNRNHS